MQCIPRTLSLGAYSLHVILKNEIPMKSLELYNQMMLETCDSVPNSPNNGNSTNNFHELHINCDTLYPIHICTNNKKNKKSNLIK